MLAGKLILINANLQYFRKAIKCDLFEVGQLNSLMYTQYCKLIVINFIVKDKSTFIAIISLLIIRTHNRKVNTTMHSMVNPYSKEIES